jgi:hypothetical protein
VLDAAGAAGAAEAEAAGVFPSDEVSEAPREGPHEAQAIDNDTMSVHRMRASYRPSAPGGLTSLSRTSVRRARAA